MVDWHLCSLFKLKDDLINCAGVGRRTLLTSQSSFPLPFIIDSEELQIHGYCHVRFGGIATDLVVGVSFNGMNDSI